MTITEALVVARDWRPGGDEWKAMEALQVLAQAYKILRAEMSHRSPGVDNEDRPL